MSKEKESSGDERREEFEAAMSGKFGEESVFLGNKKIEIESYSSGSLSMDLATGIGGFPKGRIIEIYGPESSGKTTTALMATAQVQHDGGEAYFVDAEHALDPAWARALGVDTKKLAVSQPDYGEQALEMIELSLDGKFHDIIIVDSVAALVPKEELEGAMDDIVIGGQARMLSKSMRRIASKANKAGCTVIFLNQIRMKIGQMFGNPETTPGGRALKFAASLRIEVRQGGKIKSNGSVVKMAKQSDKIIGREMKINVVKNKLAPPFKRAVVHLMFNKDEGIYGFDPVSEIVAVGKDTGVITGSSWLAYGEEKLGNGTKAAIDYLREDQGTYNSIKEDILASVKKDALVGDLDIADQEEVDAKVEEQEKEQEKELDEEE